MKRLFLITLFNVVALCAWAQPVTYEVFSLSGKVEVMVDKQWTQLSKLTPLTVTAQLKVGENSSVTVRDKKSSVLYTYSKPGEIKLGVMLSEERKRKDGLIRQVNAYTMEQLKNNSDQPRQNQMVVVGGTSRGRHMEAFSDSVYCALRQVIASFGQGNDISCGDVSMSLVGQQNDRTYYFRITNNSDMPLCVNVVRVREGVPPELCFDLGYTYDEPYLLVMGGQSVDVEQYLFASGEESTYILFASTKVFDSRHIKQLLARDVSVNDAACQIPMYFSVINTR